jgi:hypothetical protein
MEMEHARITEVEVQLILVCGRTELSHYDISKEFNK